MEFFAQLPISNDALGLIIAGIIFIVTVILIAKKLISFVITIVLLFFAIASGMAIAHNDLVREYFSKEKVSHMQHNENFFEPLRSEAVHLFRRIEELVNSEDNGSRNVPGNGDGQQQPSQRQPQQSQQQRQQSKQQAQQPRQQQEEADSDADRAERSGHHENAMRNGSNTRD